MTTELGIGNSIVRRDGYAGVIRLATGPPTPSIRLSEKDNLLNKEEV